jgi:hypothetical protein
MSFELVFDKVRQTKEGIFSKLTSNSQEQKILEPDDALCLPLTKDKIYCIPKVKETEFDEFNLEIADAD